MHRIPYWQWLRWTDEERGQVLSRLEDRKWYLDLADDKPPDDRISDFEEYEGEANSRGIDHRGYSPSGKMQLSRKE